MQLEMAEAYGHFFLGFFFQYSGAFEWERGGYLVEDASPWEQ